MWNDLFFWPRLAPSALALINLLFLPLAPLNSTNATQPLSPLHLHIPVPLLEIPFCLGNSSVYFRFLFTYFLRDIFAYFSKTRWGGSPLATQNCVLCLAHSNTYQVVLQLLASLLSHLLSINSFRAEPGIVSCCTPNSLNS